MPEPEITNKPKRWRRIGWSSLAALVLTLIGLYAFAFRRYEQQQAAIAEIERIGGQVDIRPGGPEWLREMVGDERMKVFDRVVNVDVSESEITDGGLRYLSGLTNLQDLNLDRTQITDDGLMHLSGLMSLESLDLSGTQVSDEGEKILQKALPNCDVTRK